MTSNESPLDYRYSVACPTCGVGNYERCRTLTTNRVTDTHVLRIEYQHNYRASEGGPQ